MGKTSKVKVAAIAKARIKTKPKPNPKLKGKLKTIPWDSAQYLETKQDIADYLEAVLEIGDPALLTHALGIIARAKGMTQIGRAAGLGRESLYKALSAEGNPEFATVLKVIHALGLKLKVAAKRDLAMRVFGIDFTSAPRHRKPITCLTCVLEDGVLRASSGPERWCSFAEFEHALKKSGPWIAGIDFPFGQSRTFIRNIGWPQTWEGYVNRVHSLNRKQFCDELTAYRSKRRYGDREHLRRTDTAAKSKSPQKLHGVPVGLMFFEGAPRLLQAKVTIPHLQAGDPNRIVVEAYPKMIASKIGEGKSYKNDDKKKQTENQLNTRRDMLRKINAGACSNEYGFQVVAPISLADDPSGDELDALFCAIQAAWSWTKRKSGFGAPKDCDSLLEGWIADPSLQA